MPRRFPLFAKILCWGLLNLLLLAAAAWLLLAQQMRLGLDSLLTGGAGDRVRSVAGLVVQELNDTQPEKWDAIMAKFGSAYPVEFHLIGREGAQLAGKHIDVPPEVLERLAKIKAPPFQPGPEGGRPRPGNGPPPRTRPPGPPFDGPPGLDRPDDFNPPPVRNGQDQGPPRGEPGPPPGGPVEIVGFVHAGSPKRYWLLVHAPLQRRMPGLPGALALVSDSLSAGGLVMDYGPVFWAGAGALALSALFWLPLIRSITRNIATLRDATVSISEGRFDVRVNDRRRDELGGLGAAINSMSERLAGLLNGQRRFLSDVAHELCAPLSRLQMALGILEEHAGDTNRGRLLDLREEVDHMAALVDELLSFSRAALGSRAAARLQAFPLQEAVEKVVRRESVDGVQIEILGAASLGALGDPDLFQRALGNLLRNAIRYAGQSGPITITGEARGGEVRVEVADCGPGVPEEFLPRLFDPFFRVDSARARETGGVGLGLTIARTCVEACRGTIGVRNRRPTGLSVMIVLPAAALAIQPASAI